MSILLDKIKALCAQADDGAIPFDVFMDTVLYTPKVGYYARASSVFGEEGDFVTAPTLSPVFAYCVGNQVAQASTSLPGDYVLLECGPGEGNLSAGVLERLEALDALPAALHLVERNPHQRARQKALIAQRMPSYLNNVYWHDDIPRLDSAVVLANELFDAFPVKQFCITEDGINEQCVRYDKGALCWHMRKASAPLQEAINLLQARLAPNCLPPGYCSEITMGIDAWLAELSSHVSQGILLCFDYGFPEQEFYHPERSKGTLMCHNQHRAHSDPLQAPGEQDITAHVDFSAVCLAAQQLSMAVLGFCSQAGFLMGTGLLEYPDLSPEVAASIKTLVSPAEMGEMIKALALAWGNVSASPPALMAFAQSDQSHRL